MCLLYLIFEGYFHWLYNSRLIVILFNQFENVLILLSAKYHIFIILLSLLPETSFDISSFEYS